MANRRPERTDCAQPSCPSWIGGGMWSSTIDPADYAALNEEIQELAGWRKVGAGWFCPRCVERGKATEHNPDYCSETQRTDRLGRPLLAINDEPREPSK